MEGKLVMDTTDDRWFTQTLDKMGEEKGMAFMKKLAAQKPHFRRGHTLLASTEGRNPQAPQKD